MKKDPKIFLLHMLESILDIERWTKNISQEEFFDDTKTQDAVMRKFEILGEAVKNISKDFRNAHPHVEWQEMAGMRDMLIHEYFGVDLGIVWNTAQRDIPRLRKKLEVIIKELQKNQDLRRRLEEPEKKVRVKKNLTSTIKKSIIIL
ncbi:DUF86 domain-containing protein [Candidatus Uhrbacteria bacterium]|nr:DUF86 domain-containing protein [Candidatus Uhrbacteria bacterium]